MLQRYSIHQCQQLNRVPIGPQLFISALKQHYKYTTFNNVKHQIKSALLTKQHIACRSSFTDSSRHTLFSIPLIYNGIPQPNNVHNNHNTNSDQLVEATSAVLSSSSNEAAQLGHQLMSNSTVSNDYMRYAYDHSFTIVQYCIDLLNYIHHSFGLPWVATFIATGILVRVLVLPLSVLQIRTAAISDSIRYPLQLLYDAKLQSRRPKLSISHIKETRDYVHLQSVMKLRKLFHCEFYKSLVNLFIQVPVFITVAMSIRIVTQFDPQLQSAGILWFNDLGQPDPYLILPITAVALTVYSIQRSRNNSGTNKISNNNNTETPQDVSIKGIDNLLRIIQLIAVSSTFYLSTLPSGIFIYWITTIILSITQSIIIRSRYVVQLLKRLYPSIQLPNKQLRSMNESQRQLWQRIIPLVDNIVQPLNNTNKVIKPVKVNIVNTPITKNTVHGTATNVNKKS